MKYIKMNIQRFAPDPLSASYSVNYTQALNSNYKASALVTISLSGGNGDETITALKEIRTSGVLIDVTSKWNIQDNIATRTYTEAQNYTIRVFTTSSSTPTLDINIIATGFDDYGEAASNYQYLNGDLRVGKSSMSLQKMADTVQQLANLIYPVGSIYMSMNSTSPELLFGGTWIAIEGQFLIGANSTYTAGSTGGQATVQLQQAHLPSHSHIYPGYIISPNGNWPGGQDKVVVYGQPAGTTSYNFNTSSVGSGTAHNNIPPYLAVYMWRRTG